LIAFKDFQSDFAAARAESDFFGFEQEFFG
jgi:hypothetical protein